LGGSDDQYVGCFVDNSDSVRDLPTETAALTENGLLARLQQCAQQCVRHQYMGLQWEDECFCGDSYGSQGGKNTCPAAECGLGGSGCAGRNAVYRIGPLSFGTSPPRQNVAAAANGGSVISETNQNNFHVSEMIDGITTGDANGWAFGGGSSRASPKIAVVKFAEAATIDAIDILSGVDRPDHHVTGIAIWYMACTTLAIGPGPVVGQTFAVEPAYVCPTIVNRDNWLGDETYDDIFAVTQGGGSVSVVRTDTGDSAAGWAMDLKFECCGETPCIICIHRARYINHIQLGTGTRLLLVSSYGACTVPACTTVVYKLYLRCFRYSRCSYAIANALKSNTGPTNAVSAMWLRL
jgi:hypothetical protein